MAALEVCFWLIGQTLWQIKNCHRNRNCLISDLTVDDEWIRIFFIPSSTLGAFVRVKLHVMARRIRIESDPVSKLFYLKTLPKALRSTDPDIDCFNQFAYSAYSAYFPNASRFHWESYSQQGSSHSISNKVVIQWSDLGRIKDDQSFYPSSDLKELIIIDQEKKRAAFPHSAGMKFYYYALMYQMFAIQRLFFTWDLLIGVRQQGWGITEFP